MDSCASGKPKILVMKYTGKDCSFSNNPQSWKHRCHGDPLFTDPVFILATDKKRKRTWFKGLVALDGLFDIAAANAGRTKLASDTLVKIYTDDPDEGGVLLQRIKFHTSCSKPLNVGDVFGSLELVTFTAE